MFCWQWTSHRIRHLRLLLPYDIAPSIHSPKTNQSQYIFNSLFFSPFYRTEQLIISRPNNDTKYKHMLPPPAPTTAYLNYSNLLDKAFLHMVKSYTCLNKRQRIPKGQFRETGNIVYTRLGLTKLYMGFVVLLKKMTVLINFLLQNTNFVSVLCKICQNFAGNV